MGKKRSKVTLDTNILISALGWRGNPYKILRMIIDAKIDLFISYDQFEELSRVLDYPKFEFTEQQKTRFKSLISAIANFVEPTTKLDFIREDPTDNRILECALAANVDFVISGDEHLLNIEKLERIKIVKPTDFLRANQQKDSRRSR